MAESDPNQPIETNEENEKKLKYLDFVHVAVIYAVVCLLSIYEYAKENSGPLKPGVQTVEGTVKTVIGPVYDKFHDVLFEILKFVDRKVDESLSEMDSRMPSFVKQASSQAQAMASEVQRAGVVDTAKIITRTVYTKYGPTIKELYCKYEPVVEQYAVSAWRTLNCLPLFPQVAQIVVPVAAYWSEKYNQVVYYSGEKGYALASYLPLIPIDKIAKVFEERGTRLAASNNGDSTPTQ
ncbi:PREDICTED: stress-related protein [Theobroma cacao]|uniref:Stress-related protein n=1 Tax=Theobroma cacao TaxID=3641 RepID=A0AB32VRA0_THECC|nr:PREDICTED: stress-related protein [Theobroma cacao]